MARFERAAMAGVLLAAAWAGGALAQTTPNQSAGSTSDSYVPATYADVLSHPDDPDINYRWARTQIARGDLKGAAATLERMLLINPNQPSVRLLHAIVLFRLGSYAEAGEQLHLLDNVVMDAAAREEIDLYLQQIEEKLRSTRYWALAGLGVQYDTNRNLSPSGGVTATSTLPPTLFAGPKVADWGLVAMGAGGIRQDLGMQGRAELTADASIYDDTQARFKALDILAGQMRVGGVWRGDYLTLTPNLVATGLTLGPANSDYYHSFGFDLRADSTPDIWERRWSLFADFQALDEIFHGISLDPLAGRSSGGRYTLTLGNLYRLGGGWTLGFAWQGMVKDAETRSLAYYGNNGVLTATWVFAPGQFLQGVGQYGYFPYRGVDPTVDPLHVRHDAILDARLTYGVGLDTLFGTHGPGGLLTDMTWSVTVEEIRDHSSIVSYTNNDFRVLTLFTKRFDF